MLREQSQRRKHAMNLKELFAVIVLLAFVFECHCRSIKNNKAIIKPYNKPGNKLKPFGSGNSNKQNKSKFIYDPYKPIKQTQSKTSISNKLYNNDILKDRTFFKQDEYEYFQKKFKLFETTEEKVHQRKQFESTVKFSEGFKGVSGDKLKKEIEKLENKRFIENLLIPEFMYEEKPESLKQIKTANQQATEQITRQLQNLKTKPNRETQKTMKKQKFQNKEEDLTAEKKKLSVGKEELQAKHDVKTSSNKRPNPYGTQSEKTKKVKLSDQSDDKAAWKKNHNQNIKKLNQDSLIYDKEILNEMNLLENYLMRRTYESPPLMNINGSLLTKAALLEERKINLKQAKDHLQNLQDENEGIPQGKNKEAAEAEIKIFTETIKVASKAFEEHDNSSIIEWEKEKEIQLAELNKRIEMASSDKSSTVSESQKKHDELSRQSFQTLWKDTIIQIMQIPEVQWQFQMKEDMHKLKTYKKLVVYRKEINMVREQF